MLNLYVNGELVASNAAETLDVNNDAPLRIGVGPQSYFKGKLREVRLYRRALKDDEVKMQSH